MRWTVQIEDSHGVVRASHPYVVVHGPGSPYHPVVGGTAREAAVDFLQRIGPGADDGVWLRPPSRITLIPDVEQETFDVQPWGLTRVMP